MSNGVQRPTACIFARSRPESHAGLLPAAVSYLSAQLSAIQHLCEKDFSASQDPAACKSSFSEGRYLTCSCHARCSGFSHHRPPFPNDSCRGDRGLALESFLGQNLQHYILALEVSIEAIGEAQLECTHRH